MKITGPIATNNTNHEAAKQGTAGLAGLRPGNIIKGLTLSNSQNGQLSLRVGNFELIAATNTAIQKNVQLTLKVIQLQPQLLLQIVPAQAKTDTSSSLKQALITLLPKQTGLSSLLTHSGTSQKAANYASVRSLQNAFVNAISTTTAISQASGLRQAILQSGLFLETKLSTSTGNYLSDISADLKTVLLRLLRDTRLNNRTDPINKSTPSENKHNIQSATDNVYLKAPLKGGLPASQPTIKLDSSATNVSANSASLDIGKSIEGLLARLVLHQVATVDNFSDGRNMWQLEIPVQHNNNVHTVALTIEKEAKQDGSDKDESWHINIALDLAQLGPLQIKVSLHNHDISSTFWSKFSTTQAVIGEKLEQLRSNLTDRGINSINLSSNNGAQPFPVAANKISQLLDIQA